MARRTFDVIDIWIMTRPGTLPADDQASLDAILTACSELAAVAEHVRAFATLMTERRGRDLEDWMTAATASGEPALQSFVTGLRADQDAVTRRAHPPVEFRQRGRPHQPHQNAQTPDVRTRKPGLCGRLRRRPSAGDRSGGGKGPAVSPATWNRTS